MVATTAQAAEKAQIEKARHEFLVNLAHATQRAVARCARELAFTPTVNISPVKQAMARRVTFLVSGQTRKARPVILFTCPATAERLRAPRMTGDGYFGSIAEAVRRGVKA